MALLIKLSLLYRESLVSDSNKVIDPIVSLAENTEKDAHGLLARIQLMF